jgi:hypothetical protein
MGDKRTRGVDIPGFPYHSISSVTKVENMEPSGLMLRAWGPRNAFIPNNLQIFAYIYSSINTKAHFSDIDS